MVQCLVCESPIDDRPPPKRCDGRDGLFVDCRRCGPYFLSGTLQVTLPDDLDDDTSKRSLLSHAIRKMQRQHEIPFLDSYIARQILAGSLPSAFEQADNFITWLGEALPGPGETIWVEPSTHQSIMGAHTPEGFGFVLDYIFDQGFLEGNRSKTIGAPGRAYVTLSFGGLRHLSELKKGRAASRRAFLASKWGDDTLDQVVASIFRPAIQKTGFHLQRLDDAPRAGLIDDRMRTEIRLARFLIADLTHENAGAYWEAGFAEGLGKPVIYTCERAKFEEHKTHFDTNHHLTVLWSIDNAARTEEDLKATVRATLPDEATLQDDPE